MTSPSKTLHIIIKGNVQGVGFRGTTKHYADKLKITGSAKNLSDGAVEIYAQGDKEALEAFVKELQTDKGLATIEHMTVEDYEAKKEYPNFEIIF